MRARRAHGALPVLLAALACGAAQEEGRPSVVLVTLDTVRADHLGFHGYFRDTTPSLDRFAEDAVVFENAFTTMSTTLPAHVSLLTSTTTLRHGIKGNYAHLQQTLDAAEGLRTLAQILGGAGYETAAFVSATPLKTHTGIQLGFEVFDQPERAERSATDTTERALAWLEAGPETPFFLWVHYYDPHMPFDPPRRYRGIFDRRDAQRRFLEERGVEPAAWKDVPIAALNDLYDGEIRYVDHEVGRLFRRLASAGDWPRTVVVVTGDHGEGLGEHGAIGHGTTWREQLHIPLVVKPPRSSGLVPGRRADLASIVDVAPTILTLAGLRPGDGAAHELQGVDLFDPNAHRRFAVAEREHRRLAGRRERRYALVESEWKYLHRPRGADALYRLSDDPFETRNVLLQHPDVAERMRGEIQRLVADDLRRARSQPADALPAEIRRQLEKLGYAE